MIPARRPPLFLQRLARTPAFRGLARLLAFLLVAEAFPFDAVRRAQAQAAPDVLWVDDLGGCDGQTPCFSTIQAAINAVRPGQIVRVRPGEYLEQLRIRQKNSSRVASEEDRIVVEADPAAPVGSVILRGHRERCEGGYAVDFDRSQYVTLRGLTISGAGIRGIVLRGAARTAPFTSSATGSSAAARASARVGSTSDGATATPWSPTI
jgi:hypothetical protein